jgi:hypothetical protein
MKRSTFSQAHPGSRDSSALSSHSIALARVPPLRVDGGDESTSPSSSHDNALQLVNGVPVRAFTPVQLNAVDRGTC